MPQRKKGGSPFPIDDYLKDEPNTSPVGIQAYNDNSNVYYLDNNLIFYAEKGNKYNENYYFYIEKTNDKKSFKLKILKSDGFMKKKSFYYLYSKNDKIILDKKYSSDFIIKNESLMLHENETTHQIYLDNGHNILVKRNELSENQHVVSAISLGFFPKPKKGVISNILQKYILKKKDVSNDNKLLNTEQLRKIYNTDLTYLKVINDKSIKDQKDDDIIKKLQPLLIYILGSEEKKQIYERRICNFLNQIVFFKKYCNIENDRIYLIIGEKEKEANTASNKCIYHTFNNFKDKIDEDMKKNQNQEIPEDINIINFNNELDLRQVIYSILANNTIKNYTPFIIFYNGHGNIRDNKIGHKFIDFQESNDSGNIYMPHIYDIDIFVDINIIYKLN